jgi:predicted RNA-binding protein Jag
MSFFSIIPEKNVKCTVQKVPLDYAKQFERQAKINHDQSIDQLNRRGGLSITEFYCVANGLDANHVYMTKGEVAAKWLEEQFGLLKQIEDLKKEISDYADMAVEVHKMVMHVTGSPNTTTIKGEIESMAFMIGHHPLVLNAPTIKFKIEEDDEPEGR